MNNPRKTVDQFFGRLLHGGFAFGAIALNAAHAFPDSCGRQSHVKTLVLKHSPRTQFKTGLQKQKIARGKTRCGGEPSGVLLINA